MRNKMFTCSFVLEKLESRTYHYGIFCPFSENITGFTAFPKILLVSVPKKCTFYISENKMCKIHIKQDRGDNSVQKIGGD